MVREMDIYKVKTLIIGHPLCKFIVYIDGCNIGPLEVKELVQVNWPILKQLQISRDIAIKLRVKLWEMMDAIRLQSFKLMS